MKRENVSENLKKNGFPIKSGMTNKKITTPSAAQPPLLNQGGENF
jgi:hypothetical protein